MLQFGQRSSALIAKGMSVFGNGRTLVMLCTLAGWLRCSRWHQWIRRSARTFAKIMPATCRDLKGQRAGIAIRRKLLLTASRKRFDTTIDQLIAEAAFVWRRNNRPSVLFPCQ